MELLRYFLYGYITVLWISIPLAFMGVIPEAMALAIGAGIGIIGSLILWVWLETRES